LEGLVSELVLKALEPAALEISLKVAQEVEAERQRLHQHWAQRLERARYGAERACRHYNAVEPENRLVARTLERPWEEALAREETVKAEYARFLAQQPPTLSAQEREAIRQLSTDIPALWHAPTTTAADRQAIIGQRVERVVVSVQGEGEKVELQLHWIGGHGTLTRLIRAVARLEQLSYYPQLLTRVAALHRQGYNGVMIAKVLNAEGWRAAKRRTTFTAAMVNGLLARQGVRSTRPSPATAITRAAHEWSLQELAQELAMPPQTLYKWLREGRLTARRDTRVSHPIWVIRADAAEIARLRSWRAELRTRQRPLSVL
jgi:hypothetical protein